ncbi:MAG: 1-acyl-sn-glycerol-3-phosphate acyltransferase [Candidatus Omnitrophica bacterium]|nr:1-acyl-sn-glycerol-3-phosphate acyltransferase [Candidatus Omnitrophota bacterium]
MENLPKKTNFIVIANHSSYLDPFIVGAAIPQRIYWIAIKDLYNILPVKWFMRKTETLPIGKASDRLIQLLMKNKNVGLFPEGARNRNGMLKEFRRGAALLALRTGRPIVPCAIHGAYEALPVLAKFPKFVPITIKIGAPQYLLKEFEDVIDDVSLQKGTFRIQNAVKEMLYAKAKTK